MMHLFLESGVNECCDDKQHLEESFRKEERKIGDVYLEKD